MDKMVPINKTSPKKPIKRRSHSRKVPKDYLLNIAEARREIVNALHLHRASSSSSSSSSNFSSSSSSTTTTTTTPSWVYNMMDDTSHNHCTFLMEPIPKPQPTWSTTSPSIYPTTTLPTTMEVLEFEWGDNNIASSYTWWLGFLKSLDKPHEEEEEDEATSPFGEEVGVGNFRLFSKYGTNSKGGGEEKCVTSTTPLEIDDQSSVLDEWLTVPSSECSDDQMDDH